MLGFDFEGKILILITLLPMIFGTLELFYYQNILIFVCGMVGSTASLYIVCDSYHTFPPEKNERQNLRAEKQ